MWPTEGLVKSSATLLLNEVWWEDRGFLSGVAGGESQGRWRELRCDTLTELERIGLMGLI